MSSYLSLKESMILAEAPSGLSERQKDISCALSIFSNRFLGSSILLASLLSKSIVFLLRMEICLSEDLSELIFSKRRLLVEGNGTFYINYNWKVLRAIINMAERSTAHSEYTLPVNFHGVRMAQCWWNGDFCGGGLGVALKIVTMTVVYAIYETPSKNFN